MKLSVACLVVVLMVSATIGEAKETTVKEILVKCRVTKYTKAECPNKYTSSGKIPKEGYVAVSRDLYKTYSIPYGANVYIEGYKERNQFYAEDKVGAKITKVNKKTGRKYSFKLQKTVDLFEDHQKDKWYLNEAWITITWEN